MLRNFYAFYFDKIEKKQKNTVLTQFQNPIKNVDWKQW
jgi:hypothetical protein